MAALHIDGECVATVATIVVVMCGEDCDSRATAEAMRALAKSLAHYQIMILQIGRVPVFESVDASQLQYLSCTGDGLFAVVREVVEPVDEEIARGFGVIRRSLHQHARCGRLSRSSAPNKRMRTPIESVGSVSVHATSTSFFLCAPQSAAGSSAES